MVVTFVLGFVAAWRHDFGSKDASTLNRMVLQYAAQASLLPRSQASPAGGLGHHGAVREWPESCSQHLERRDDEAA
jgi:hypothetical protein